MRRRFLLTGLEATLVALFALGVACQDTNYPGLVPADTYEAGRVIPSNGGGGGGGSGSPDGSVPDAPSSDHVVAPDTMSPTDGKTPPPDTGVPPPCTGCLVLTADSVESPVSLALDVANVYWTQGTSSGGVPVSGSGSIRSIPRTGGSYALLDTVLTGPQIVKVANTWTVWSALGDTSGTGSVSTQRSGAGVPVASGLTTPFGVDLDSTNVYWVSSGGGGVEVQSAPLSGGTVATLGTASGGFQGYGLAVNASSIYFVAQLSGGGGGLFELPLGDAGGTPTEVWKGNATSKPVDVALDATSVYWTDEGNGAVYSRPLAGGAASTLATKASGLVGPVRIAVDSTNLYFSDTAASSLFELPLATKTLKTLVTGVAVVGVAADDNDGNVYFSSATEILSIAK